MNLENLVFDRSQADIDRLQALKAKALSSSLTAAEKAEYDQSKAAYTADRLNIIGAVEAEIIAALESYLNIRIEAPTPKTDWSIEDIPTRSQMEDFLTIVRGIAGAVELQGLPKLPDTMDNLKYSDANAIEQTLWIVGDYLRRTYKGFNFAGLEHCGR